METCTEIQSRRKTQLIREYSRGAIDCSQYENFTDDLNFVGFWSSTLNDFWGMARNSEWNTDSCGE